MKAKSTKSGKTPKGKFAHILPGKWRIMISTPFRKALFLAFLPGVFGNTHAEEQEIRFWDCVKRSEQCDPTGRLIENDLFRDANTKQINMWELYLSLPLFIEDNNPSVAAAKGGAERAKAVIVRQDARHLFAGDGAQSRIGIHVIEWEPEGRNYLLDVTVFAVGDEEYHYLFKLKGVPEGWEVISVTPIVNQDCCG